VDYLTAILGRAASRTIPSSHRYEDGELRVIAIGPTFAGLVAGSFDQIRSSAQGNVAVLLRMLGALQTIASLTSNRGRRRILGEQVQYVAELAERSLESPPERLRFESRLAHVCQTLGMEPASFAESNNRKSSPLESRSHDNPFHLKTRATEIH